MTSGWKIRDLLESTGGRLTLGSLPPLGGVHEPLGPVATRLEQIRKGDLYWDVTDRRRRGEWSVEEAFFRGAQGVVASGPKAEPWAGRFMIEVADPAAALRRFIQAARARYSGRTVAAGGEVGKSTALHLIRSALGAGALVEDAAADSNASNSPELGLRLERLANAFAGESPYALIELPAEADERWNAAVGRLQPDLLVLASVPRSDVDESEPTVRRLAPLVRTLDRLPGDRVVVMNGDDPLLRRAAECTAARVVTVGRGAHCDLFASDVECRDGRLTCRVDGRRISAPLWGRHQITALLAAYAVGRLLDRSPDQIVESLQAARPLPMRCEVIRTPHYTVINDAGSCRPASIGPALELLRDFNAPGRRIVVCGEMDDAAVGSGTGRAIGDAVVARCGADWLVTWGRQSDDVLHAARDAGLPAGRAVSCRNARDGAERLSSLLRDGDVVLVKGPPTRDLQQLVRRLVGLDDSSDDPVESANCAML